MNTEIETFTGRHFNPLAPVIADIEIEDIAHALSHQCRFSGHTRVHYSVAEHSVRVSELLATRGYARDVQLWGLLHDASEAYLVDLPSPLKLDPVFGDAYRKAEGVLMRAVCLRFGLQLTEPPAVREADATLLATEARDLMPYSRPYWAKLTATALDTPIVPWKSTTAKRNFVRRYSRITE